jgi:hypothetical protein
MYSLRILASVLCAGAGPRRCESALTRCRGGGGGGDRHLRVPKVHHLIEQLVRDDEVVADALLVDLVEVALEHLDHAVQKVEHHHCVGVLLGHRHEDEVVVAHVDERAPAVGDDRCQLALFVLRAVRGASASRRQPRARRRPRYSGCVHVARELVHRSEGHIPAVVAGDDDLPLHVHDEDRRRHLRAAARQHPNPA